MLPSWLEPGMNVCWSRCVVGRTATWAMGSIKYFYNEEHYFTCIMYFCTTKTNFFFKSVNCLLSNVIQFIYVKHIYINKDGIFCSIDVKVYNVWHTCRYKSRNKKKNPDPQSSGTLLKMEVNLNLYHFFLLSTLQYDNSLSSSLCGKGLVWWVHFIA